ncbi:unnamed protein product [Paramecium primaurelia]|uniref:Transmembrane protein n=1 Tax=Paramecium primaurelia TaxID=5886 RepID=A0A8S1N3H7_PARPR|nr:unnamed protein product [Paramecium primaurelia]
MINLKSICLITSVILIIQISFIFEPEELYIPFQKQFAQVPDFYSPIVLLDLKNKFRNIHNYYIASPQLKIFLNINFRVQSQNSLWFAFNDDIVQVINNFNIITHPQTQYAHSYQKDCQENLVLFNFVINYPIGSQYYYLIGLGLTPETLTISFQFYSLKQFGYHILLNSFDIFLIGPPILIIKLDGLGQVVNFPTKWTIQNCYLNLLGFKHKRTDFNIRYFMKTTYSSQVTFGIYPCNKFLIYFGVPLIIYQFNIITFVQMKLFFLTGKNKQFFDPNNQIDAHIEIKKINYSQNQMLLEEITIAQSIGSITIILLAIYRFGNVQDITILSKTTVFQTTIKCDIKQIHRVRLSLKLLQNQNQQQQIQIAKISVSLFATQLTNHKLEIV